jgi:hypothetical protein
VLVGAKEGGQGTSSGTVSFGGSDRARALGRLPDHLLFSSDPHPPSLTNQFRLDASRLVLLALQTSHLLSLASPSTSSCPPSLPSSRTTRRSRSCETLTQEDTPCEYLHPLSWGLCCRARASRGTREGEKGWEISREGKAAGRGEEGGRGLGRKHGREKREEVHLLRGERREEA